MCRLMHNKKAGRIVVEWAFSGSESIEDAPRKVANPEISTGRQQYYLGGWNDHIQPNT